MHFNTVAVAMAAAVLPHLVTAGPVKRAATLVPCAPQGSLRCKHINEIQVCANMQGGLYWNHGTVCPSGTLCYDPAGREPHCRTPLGAAPIGNPLLDCFPTCFEAKEVDGEGKEDVAEKAVEAATSAIESANDTGAGATEEFTVNTTTDQLTDISNIDKEADTDLNAATSNSFIMNPVKRQRENVGALGDSNEDVTDKSVMSTESVENTTVDGAGDFAEKGSGEATNEGTEGSTDFTDRPSEETADNAEAIEHVEHAAQSDPPCTYYQEGDTRCRNGHQLDVCEYVNGGLYWRFLADCIPGTFCVQQTFNEPRCVPLSPLVPCHPYCKKDSETEGAEGQKV